MPENLFDQLVDFETPDGLSVKVRRAEAEQFAQEGKGTIREPDAGPATPAGPGDPNLPGAANSFSPTTQTGNPLQTEATIGPGGLILESLDQPAQSFAGEGVPMTEQELRLSLEEQGVQLGLDGGVVPANPALEEPPITAPESPPVPLGTPDSIAEATAQQEAARAATQPQTGALARRPVRRSPAAAGPVVPTRGQQLVSGFEEAEQKVNQAQQASALLRSQGFADAAAAVEASITDTNEFVAQRRQVLEQEQRELEAEKAERTRRVAQLESEIEATDISDNRSLGNRMLGGLMIGLFQAGSTIAGAAGTPNAALNIIQTAVRQDIDSQKQKLLTKKGLLSSEKNELGRLAAALGSVDAAELKLEELRLGQAKKKLEALSLQSQSAQHKQNAATMGAELDQLRAQRKVEAENKRLAAESAIEQQRRARAFELTKQRRDQAFELKKLGVKAAIDQQKVQQEFGKQIGDEVARLEKESFNRNLDERKFVGDNLAKVIGTTNPQAMHRRLLDQGFLKKMLSSDSARARSLQEQMIVMVGMQKIKGAASDRDMEMVRRGLSSGVFDDPDTLVRILEDFMFSNARDEATLLAGSKNPQAAAIFKQRKDEAISRVRANPSFSPVRSFTSSSR